MVHNNENDKFFYYNFVKVVLEASKSIRKTKKLEQVFKIAILYLKTCFSLVTLSNSHSMICIC